MALDLNDKPWYVPLLIAAVLGAVLFFFVTRQLFEPTRERITEVEQQNEELRREIQKGLAAKRDLPRLEAEIRSLTLELDRLRRILPTRRETPDLIKKLRQLTQQGELQLQRFAPSDPVDREFYEEWPIDVNLRGTYHELGKLFDRLSRFSRIINVVDLTLRPSNRSDRYTIDGNFTMQTFIYKEEQETAAAPQGGSS